MPPHGKAKRAVLQIDGMHDPSSVASVKNVLSSLDGMASVNIDLNTHRVTIVYYPAHLTVPFVKNTIANLGFTVSESKAKEKGLRIEEKYVEVFLIVFTGTLMFLNWLTPWKSVLGVNTALIGAVVGGFPVYKDAVFALLHKRISANVLVTIAAIGAISIGYYLEAAEVFFIMLIGEALELFAVGKTRSSIKQLMDLTPKTARVRRDGTEVEIPLEKVVKGDIVIVKPGERIPIDGVVSSGNASVNQAPITGESMPVDKNVGDKVFGGTVNAVGVLEIETMRIGADSTVERMIALVEDAQSKKAPIQRLADRYSQWFVPLTLGVALVVFLVTGNLVSAITVLVIACPCSLVLATPTAVVAGIGNAAKKGILIKGGETLETAGNVDAIVVDKTGTITVGNTKVVGITSFGSKTENEVLALAAIAERYSEHPIAKAIIEYVENDPQLKFPAEDLKADDAEILPGRGVVVDFDGRRLMVGNGRLFHDRKIAIPKKVDSHVHLMESEGKTTILVAENDTVVGTISVADVPRPEASETIKQFKKMGIKKIVMLSGDATRVTNSISSQIGIEEAYSELMPEEKVRRVKELKDQGFKVAMIGDGINDAPALAIADIGIAMGVAGTDVAIEVADIALMADDLTKVPQAINLSRRTLKIIHQSIAYGVISNVAGVVAAIFLWWIVTPGVAAIMHQINSTIVVLNALRVVRNR